MLSEHPGVSEVDKLGEEAHDFLKAMEEDFSLEDARRVKEIESATNHDVKAVEYFVKERMANVAELARVSEFVHFSCTSEDINNLSYALLLEDARSKVLKPAMHQVVDKLCSLADDFADYPMLARTHGQPATPTTVGKELANFAYRMDRQVRIFLRCFIHL